MWPAQALDGLSKFLRDAGLGGLVREASVSVGGTELGVALPGVLLLLPLALVALTLVTFRTDRFGPLSGTGDWGRRKRWILFGTRVVVVVCLVTAAAGPYTLVTRTTEGDPRVRMLVDESDSMAVTDAGPEALAAAIEREGVPVSTSVVGSANSSRLGDAIVANADPNGSVLVVSDGRVTGGRSLTEAADIARSAGTTVHAVDVSAVRPERYVTLAGPAKTSVGTDNAFRVGVGGAAIREQDADVTVSVDGVPVFTDTVTGEGGAEFTYAFDEVGTHRLVARVDSDDTFGGNDVYRRTVRVVPKPRVLYVSQGDYPFGRLLERLYNVTRADRVPDDLSPYQTVVMQDTPASAVGNVSALQRAVINGTGLVVAGGPNAYDRGGYADSPLASTLPVSMGESAGRTARIVLLVDVSGSAEQGMRVQKAVALDVLDQLGDENEVGIVGFNWRAYEVAELVELSEGRSRLESRIRRLQSGGATDVGIGLQGAAEMLGGPGTVILVSDGRDAGSSAAVSAERLAQRGIQVVSVGVGRNVDEDLLQSVARPTGGQYIRADETDRLRLLFGGDSRTFSSDRLTVVDPNQFITAGVTPTANPELAHQVSVKPGADFLVATGEGTPAFTQWRYGLGRVVAITAYGADGTLGGLLEEPDSLLLSKSVNWAVGDPERNARGVVSAPDTRVGEAVTVRYVGTERPEGPPSFRQVAPGTYEATLRPTEAGFVDVLDASLAVNYPVEQGGYGQTSLLGDAVRSTGGAVFDARDAAAIADRVKRAERRSREIRETWAWLLLTLALLTFLGEVAARRLSLYRRRTGTGLPVGGDD